MQLDMNNLHKKHINLHNEGIRSSGEKKAKSTEWGSIGN